ncbi:hypothetical protein CR513_03466, partial [Mucuna pruriens]
MEELVEEYFQLDSCSEGMEDLARTAEASSCSKADHNEVLESPDSEDDHSDSAKEGRVNASSKVNSADESNTQADTLTETISASKDQTRAKKLIAPPGSKIEATKGTEADLNPTRAETNLPSRPKQHKAETVSAILMPSQEQAGQTDPRAVTQESPSPPPMELKPLPSHLKYAFLDSEQQLPVIIASNLLPEQEDKLLEVLRQHKQAIVKITFPDSVSKSTQYCENHQI